MSQLAWRHVLGSEANSVLLLGRGCTPATAGSTVCGPDCLICLVCCLICNVLRRYLLLPRRL